MAQLIHNLQGSQPTGLFESTLTTVQDQGKYIYLKGGQVQKEGNFGHLFTRTATNIATTTALQKEITAKYGKSIGDALAPTFDRYIKSGKQLTVGMAKSLFANAAKINEMQSDIAQLKLDGFLNEKNTWSPAEKQMTRNIMAAVATHFPNTYRDIPLLNGASPTYALEIITRNIEQKFGNGQIYQSLPTQQEKEDMLLASAYLFQDGSVHTFVAEKLPLMREIQPHGTLTPETVWTACYGENMPDIKGLNGNHLTQVNMDKFSDNIIALCERKIGSAISKPEGVTHSVSVSFGLFAQIKLESAVDHSVTPGALSLDDFSIKQEIYTPSSMDETKKQLELDLHRQGTPTTISIQNPGAEAYLFDSVDTEGMSAGEIKSYESGAPNPKTDSLFDHVRTLCDGNETQMKTVLWGLTQSGVVTYQRSASMLVKAGGEPLGEHAALLYSLSKQADGTIILEAQSPENAISVSMHCKFEIYPDGTSRATQLDMTPVPNPKSDPTLAQ